MAQSFEEALPGLQAAGFNNVMDALNAYLQSQQQAFYAAPSAPPAPTPTVTPTLQAPSGYADYGPSTPAPTPAPTPTVVAPPAVKETPPPPEEPQTFAQLSAPEPTTDYAKLVSGAYSNILNRPADVGGQEFWLSQLQSGKVAPSNFESVFKESARPELDVKALYEDVLKRQADPSGLSHWISQIGSGGITPEERQRFINEAIKAGEIKAPVTPTTQTTTEPTKPPEMVVSAGGKDYDKETLYRLAQQIAPNVTRLQGGVFAESTPSVGFSYDVGKSILGKDPTVADQVILDMAKGLMDRGITDLKQMEIRDVRKDVTVVPSFEGTGFMRYIGDPYGEGSGRWEQLSPEENARVQAVGDAEGGFSYIAKDIITGPGLYSKDKLFAELYPNQQDITLGLGETYSGPGMTGYQLLVNPGTGKLEFSTFGASTGEADLINFALTAASFIPGAQPFAIGIKTAIAVQQGDYLSALANLANLGEFKDAATALNVVRAAQNGDAVGVVSVLMSNPTIANSVGNIDIGNNITMKDVSTAIGVANAASKGDWTTVTSLVGVLTKSADIQTAATAARIIQAVDRGDFATAANAVKALDQTIQASNNINTQKVSTQISNAVNDTLVKESGEDNTWTAVYNNAIKNGATVDEAEDAANAISQVKGAIDTTPVSDIDITDKDEVDRIISGGIQVIDMGEFEGLDKAYRDAIERNILKIGNTEADTPEEAAALAASKGYASYTFGGQTYQLSLDVKDLLNQINEQDKATQVTTTPATTFDPKDVSVVKAQLLESIKTSNLTGAYTDMNPADLSSKEMASFVDNYVKATPEQRARLLSGSDQATYKVIDGMLQSYAGTSAATAGQTFVQPTGFGSITASDMTNYNQIMNTGVRTAGADLIGLGLRAGQTLGEVFGYDTPTLDKMQDLMTKEKETQMSKLVGNEKAVAGGIASGITSVLSWTFGGPLASVATNAGVVANNSWIEGSNAVIDSKGRTWANADEAKANGVWDFKQLTPEENGKRTAIMTSLEIVGETLGIPGMTRLMKELPITGSTGDIVNYVKNFALGMGMEQASELLTTTAQMAADKWTSVGLGKNATFEDYKNALADTAVATAAAVGTASSTASAIGNLNNAAKTTNVFSEDTRDPVEPTLPSLQEIYKSYGVDQKSLDTLSTDIKNELKTGGTNLESIRNNTVETLQNAGVTEVRAEKLADEMVNRVIGQELDTTLAPLNLDESQTKAVKESVIQSLNNNVGPEQLIQNVSTSLINSGQSAEVVQSVLSTISSATSPVTNINVVKETDPNTGSTTQTVTTPTTQSTVTTNTETNTTTKLDINLDTNVQTNTVNDVMNQTVVQTVTNPNTNINTQTVVNTNTNTTTQVTTNNNTNTETTVTTDQNTNTQTTTVVDTTTNTVVETTTTTVPDDWTPPVIDTPPPPPTVTPPPVVTPPPPVSPPPPKTEPPKTPSKTQQLGGLLPLLGAGEVISDDELTFKDPFISSRVGQQKFKGTLDPFLAEVEAGSYLAPEEVKQAEDELQRDTEMMNYFTYGVPRDIEEVLGPPKPKVEEEEFETEIFARGGLATPLMAKGGTTRYGQYAGGGLPMVAHSGKARLDFRSGAAVTGPGDGQSDDIPAMLADGEFVIPADVVAALGNGSTKAGSDKLYDMMHSIRAHHRSAGPKDLPPPAKKNPLDYIKSKKARR